MEPRTDLQRRIAQLSPAQQELLSQRLGTLRETPAESGEPKLVRRGATRAPLSFAQQRLWFLDQLDPGSPHYNVAMAAPISGELAPDVLERSLQVLVGRHEALRTTFELGDGDTPVQVVHNGMDVPLGRIDLTHVTVEDRQETVEAAVASLAQETFDLATGPLVKARLLRLSVDEHVVATSMHHIISDIWSIEIMLRELAVVYRALQHGQEVPLPEPQLQYADYAQWQREWLAGAELDRQVTYWRDQLSGELPPLALPTDRPRPAHQDYRGAHLVHRLPAELSVRLDALSVSERTTPFTLFLTAIAALLHRYTGQTNIIVGAPVSNRSRAELEGTVGYLGNTLALRTDFSGGPSFREALRRTHEVTLDAFAHQDLPFDKVVELAEPDRDLSRTPLLQVVFVYHTPNTPTDEATTFNGLGDTLPVDNGTTKFDLTFGLEHSAGSHRLTLEYSTALFDVETIDRMARHWESLLTAMADDPEAPVGSARLMSAEERHRMVVQWNATGQPFPDTACLHELIEQQAVRTPHAVAASDPAGSLTYAELATRAGRLAAVLQEHGAGPDLPVAVCLDKSVDVAVGLLGVLKSGSAYLPLAAGTPTAHARTLLDDAGARILVTEEPLVRDLDLGDDISVVLIDLARQSTAPQTRAAPEVTSDNLAYVIYTSGSTGRPKGVMLDHRGRVNNFHDFNTRFGVGPGDKVFALAALNFDMSAYDVMGTLMSGARIIFPERGADRDPAHWLDRLRDDRVTVWHSVPALLEMLVEYAESEGSSRLPDLRLVLLGGDWIPTALPDRIRALAPSAQVIALGGATEVSMDSTIYEVGAIDPEARSIPYGKPMANQRCYVLDGNLLPVPVGVAGELYLAGVGVGRGYLGDPELTRNKFLASPLPEELGRIYRTGDLVRYLADGNLELLGRVDHQVKIRGWRIEPAEIQAVLRQHPAVRESLVVAYTEPNGVKRLVAYVLGDEDAFDAAELRGWLAGRLPDYLVPSSFVRLDRFPLTPNGKLDRRRLPTPPAADTTTTGYVAPRSDTERALAEIWQELVGADKVGIDDNFFALGGDSIKTIQVVARAKKRGVLLRPKQLFQHQSVRELAAVAERVGEAPAGTATATGMLDDALVQRLRAEHPDMVDAYPLTVMQRRMLVNAVERPVEGLYIIHADYLFKAGGLEADQLVQAWQIVADRHPALRTSFVWEGLDEPVQVVHRHAAVEVERHDLRGLTTDEQLRRQDEVVEADRRRGFDLARTPLVRIHLLRLTDDSFKYISCNHHIVLDGWSRATVQQEVFAAYEALRAGQDVVAPPFRPFRDYVSWAQSQDLSAARQVWSGHLDGLSGPTPLVAARGLPDPSCTGAFAKQREPLPPASTEALTRFTKAHQVTPNTVIQAAWLLLMSRYTGWRDVVLGVMSSGRGTELLDVETVVGVCINALPVRAVVDPQRPLLAWLLDLQRQQAELREYDYVPLDVVQQWHGSAGPLFECLMVFENYPWDGSLSRLADRLDFEHPMAQRDYQVAQFEYPLRVEVAPRTPLLIMHYYRNAFADETVTQMIRDWAETIDRMVRDADQPLGGLLAG